MARPIRIEFPGANYHITSRSNSGKKIFLANEDRVIFLNILNNVVQRFSWLLHSYVMMDDHFHLVVETPQGHLSRGMRQLNGVYTQYFNRHYNLEGPIFQGRFKSILFEKKNYLLPLCRHVVLNPVRLGTQLSLDRHLWSSFRSTIGVSEDAAFLYTADLLSVLSKQVKTSRRKFREYVEAGINEISPLSERSNQVLLGSPEFLKEMQPKLLGERMRKRGPKQARRRKSLLNLFPSVESRSRAERNKLIRKAHVDYGYTLVEIGKHLGLHYTTVSKVVNSFAHAQNR